jgi:serine/threonine protein kinase
VSRVGGKLGPYELVAELGRGGMATLFLARRVGPAGFSRPVAIKIIHREHQNDRGFLEMFLDEARLSARVQHPNVVHVEELGEDAGIPYLVMEYVDGVTLVDVMRALHKSGRSMPIEIAVAIAAQIADGLHAAHESTDDHGRPLGLVHRDVSPHNILLSSRGYVKLIDFGIARARGRLTTTALGEVKGKTAYLTPEQIAGEPTDRRGDVFALGIVLWEMLAMQRLFYAQSEAATLMRVREARADSPRTHRPEISEALEHVVMVALARAPADRFQTAYAFRRALLGACKEALFVEPAQLAPLVRDAARDALERRTAGVPEELREITSVGPATLTSLSDLDNRIGALTARDVPTLETLIAEARSSGDTSAELAASLRLANLLGGTKELARAWALFAELEPRLAEASVTIRAFAVSVRAYLCAQKGDIGGRLAANAEALELAEEAGLVRRAMHEGANIASAYGALGLYAEAERSLLVTRARARQLGSDDIAAQASLNLASIFMDQGRFVDAEAELAPAFEWAVMRGGRVAIVASIYRTELLCGMGLWTAAHAQGEKARALAVSRDDAELEVRALVHLSRASLALGDREGALSLSTLAYATREALGGLQEYEALLFLAHARALEANGRGEQAARVCEAGRARLLAIAGRISDAEHQRRFLEDVSTHAELMAR